MVGKERMAWLQAFVCKSSVVVARSPCARCRGQPLECRESWVVGGRALLGSVRYAICDIADSNVVAEDVCRT